MQLGAVHKVRHAIFGQFWPPSPCHTLSHIPEPPRKYVTHLGPPQFLVGLVQKSRTKVPCTNCISIVCGGFCPGGFVRVGFCPFPLLSHNRKLNITLNFMFHMYDKNVYKRDVTCSWPLSPSVTNCHSFSNPSPSSVTHFMDGPMIVIYLILYDQ